ncbi:MAG: flagellar biosynthesis protein FlhB [Candidatus Latescibacteria bacterium]|nr:flagellar biosynthesis protein FlhB [Candidatus Latescibacterota bacterium]
MAEETGQEKTEQATDRRREDTRKRGQVARSTEVNSALMLLTGFTVLLLFRGHFLREIENVIAGIFNLIPSHAITPSNIRVLFISLIWKYFYILLPVFIVLALAGIIVNIMQVGIRITGEPLLPKLEKVNPIEGFKRIFSRRSLETLIRDIIKIILVAWIGFSAINKILPHIMEMPGYTVGQIFSFTGYSVFSIAMKILIGYVALAVMDYIFQRWDYERSMMMTKQEIREEMKQTEGDPLLKARIRSVQREIARRRMMEEIPKADVVVTNPTEIAVALSYEPGMNAPVVVAKGRRLIAEKIREIAEKANVPIVENVILAQALYKAVDIGYPIPGDLYAAVAEVLAYVYQLKEKKML